MVRYLKWAVLFAVPCLVWTCPVSAQNPLLVAETEPLTAQEQLTKFHLPPGFRIELIATEPDCQKPMNLKFDAAGRLWFTQSIEYPWPIQEGQTGRDTIRVMTDTNDDGVPDETSVFATGLNIPIGVTPVSDGVLGYSIPTLYAFADLDGDGRSDSQRELYRTFGFRDTHGMCSSLNWWIDGWVYGCHGFANDSEVTGADGKPVKMNSGNTYRLRPDGSHIEYVTHGQVNPFGMCFDPLGNQYVSDCHTKPAYVVLRGAYYPSFGKPHDGLGYGPELMQHLHGSTGIAGVVYYAAQHFPAEFHDNLIIGNPVTGRINRDRLEVHGSTYQAIEQPDFLTCDDPWFRPVDLQLAPDGSLYIADFYNRIIGHYEVPLTHPGRDRERGRIWRVSYVGTDGNQTAPRIADLTQATTEELLQAVDHPHLPVRVQATHQLVDRMGSDCQTAVSQLLETGTATQQAHALWVLERLAGLSDQQLQAAAAQPDRLVRVHLAKALAERSEWTAVARQIASEQLLFDSDPFVRRAAVDAVGRHPLPGLERPLIAVWLQAAPNDALLIHTAKMAVRDVLVSEQSEISSDLRMWSSAERRCLLEAILGTHQAAAAKLALRMFRIEPWPEPLAADLTQFVMRYLPADRLAEVEWVLNYYRTQGEGLQLAIVRSGLRGMQQRGQALPESWMAWGNDLAGQFLSRNDEGALRIGLELIRDLRLINSATLLPQRLAESSFPPSLLVVMLETLAALDHPELVTTATALLSREDLPVELRQQTAQLLGGWNRDDARAALLARLSTAPSNMALAIGRGLALTPTGAELLLQSIETGKASARLLTDATIDQRLHAAKLTEFDNRRAKLLEGLPEVSEELTQLIQQRKQAFLSATPNLEQGRLMFEKTCAACHRIGNKGAKVGPELDGVGLHGLDRLLEDTLDPNRNVDGAFRSTVLVLQDGKVLVGLVAREEGAVIVLINEQGQEVRVNQADIEERQQTRLSPMPANVSDKLKPEEYVDLLGYLLDQRVAPTKAP
ncbi:c-type cytochrome [bacterium]|nr:c-type cytochrome [bacterium]